jgi:hypothetical protein
MTRRAWRASGRLVCPVGGITNSVGMSPDSSQSAAVDDEILLANWPVGEPALEDFANPGGIACVIRQCGSRHVWRHAVMWHRPPGVVRRRWLGKLHVTRVTGELTAFKSADDGIPVADPASGGVHDVGAALHLTSTAEDRIAQTQQNVLAQFRRSR